MDLLAIRKLVRSHRNVRIYSLCNGKVIIMDIMSYMESDNNELECNQESKSIIEL